MHLVQVKTFLLYGIVLKTWTMAVGMRLHYGRCLAAAFLQPE